MPVRPGGAGGASVRAQPCGTIRIRAAPAPDSSTEIWYCPTVVVAPSATVVAAPSAAEKDTPSSPIVVIPTSGPVPHDTELAPLRVDTRPLPVMLIRPGPCTVTLQSSAGDAGVGPWGAG